MSKEIKIGILTLIAILVLIFGLKFLKGKDIFYRNQSFIVEYKNVNGLTISTPIFVNGFQVGIVSDIYLKPEDMQTVVVVLEVDKSIGVPKNTVAEISDVGFMGNKMVNLSYNTPCGAGDCAKSGDRLAGTVKGLLGSLIGQPDNIGEYINQLKFGINGVLDTINDYFKDADKTQGLGLTLHNIQKIVNNLALVSAELNKLIAGSNENIQGTFKNLNSISGNLSKNNEQISGILANFNDLSNQLKSSDIDGTVGAAKTTFVEAGARMNELQGTLKEANQAISKLSNVFNDVQSGKGTLGKLMKDDDLYVNLERTSKNLELLLQDLRLNPKRYVNVSVFGKKQKEYDLPEDDPATPIIKDQQQDSILNK